MEKKKRFICIVAFCILIVMIIGGFIHCKLKINSLDDNVSDLREKNINLNQAVNFISDEMRAYINNKTSLANKFSVDVDSYDTDKKNIKLIFKVIPKEYLSATNIYITSGTKKINLNKTGEEFVGSETFGFDEEVKPILFVESNGEKNIDAVYENSIGKAIYTLVPELAITGSVYADRDKKKVSDEYLHISLYRGNMDNVIENKIFNVNYKVIIDDKTVKDTDFDVGQNNSNDFDVISQSQNNIKNYKVKQGQNYKVIMTVKKDNGYLLKYNLYHFKFNESYNYNCNKNFVVYSPDGKVIYDSNK